MANKTEGLTFLQKLKNLQDIMGEYAWIERWCPICERKDTPKSGRRNDCPLKLVEGNEDGRECEYCDNSKKLIAREFPHVIYGKISYDNEWQIIVDRGYIRLCNTDDMQCLDHGEKIKIKYCPMCGKKL